MHLVLLIPPLSPGVVAVLDAAITQLLQLDAGICGKVDLPTQEVEPFTGEGKAAAVFWLLLRVGRAWWELA